MWESLGQEGAGSTDGIFGQRYDASGNRLGAPSVAIAPDKTFVVTWASRFQVPGGGDDMFARRFDAAGNGIGGEFQVNTYTTNEQDSPTVTADALGNFVVVWESRSQDGSDDGVMARRFASDSVGNFTVAWHSYPNRDGSSAGVFVQRFGGLFPRALSVFDGIGGGNGVHEPGESVNLTPTWRNDNGASQAFSAVLSGFTGPAGATYTIGDGSGDYGTVANAIESISPDAHGQQKRWALHIGNSFTDVATTGGFYPFIETLLHHGITGGCGGTNYCPASSTTRAQISVFTLVAKEGVGYQPPACTTPVFNDAPPGSPFCPYIEELARRGVVAGCGNGNYCPGQPVTRAQIGVFVSATFGLALYGP